MEDKVLPEWYSKEDNGEYLSLFLELVRESTSNNVRAIFDAFLVEKDDEPSSTHADRGVHVHPTIGYTAWGWPQFVKRSDLESSSSSYVVDGKVRIMCVVIVIRDNTVPVPPSDIGAHLGGLLDRGEGTDVSFLVDGETFPAHRAVLAARSPVFRAELLGSMAESKMSSITLHDIEPLTFRALLRFIYTDKLPADDGGDQLKMAAMATDELFQKLLAAADRYDLSRLKLMCAQKLWEAVSVDTVATTLIHAEMHGCPELKSSCLDFFVQDKNFKETVLTEGYVQLVQRFPSIKDEIRGLLRAKSM
ncbi:BTB/POZ and MATH domain-containing protein 2-like [Oryza glaberrima]|uniref:BTB/POZ and MATH domain-containing protein 2-like n=1 Tax=Oryza glaberrima TaxID=4538 RepID=UPI00224BF1CA|nr:BTB/POZ and MATH domain-containing protein 2-like [Oryza glaberrima]